MVKTEGRANRQTLIKLIVVAIGMFGFGFAMIPFYRAFCEAIGYYDVARADVVPANTQVDTARSVTVQFDTNLRSDLPWSFRAMEKSVRIHPGEFVQVVFEVSNRSDRAVTGQAIPSYGPQVAGRHFKKLECFCFSQQTLAPGEVRQMPVAFVIDPDLPVDVSTITLSYTFFEVEGRAADRGGGNDRGRAG